MQPNYYVLQSNPDKVPLIALLQHEEVFHLPVRRYKEDMVEGDRVLLYLSGKQGGIYGLGTITESPHNKPLPEYELKHYEQEPPKGPYVAVRVDHNLVFTPMLRSFLKSQPHLATIKGGRTGYSFSATAEEFKAVESLCLQKEALDDLELPMATNTVRHPLNRILYGPPGTGKTYMTVNYALSIIEGRPLDELALEDRQLLRRRYFSYMEGGQIQMVSFHQSFSYEDFVEGIKPYTENKQVFYEIEDGIFKQISLEARRAWLATLMSEIPQKPIQFDFRSLYKAFLNFLKSDNFDKFQGPTGRQLFLHRINRNGNFTVRPEKSYILYTINRSRVKSLYENLVPGTELAVLQKQAEQLTGANNTNAYLAVLQSLKQFEPVYADFLSRQQEAAQVSDELVEEVNPMPLMKDVLDKTPRYVLIIDEINRGNVAGIFGDMITLIEPDKRDGCAESLFVQLPYSKMTFSVPPTSTSLVL